MNIKGSGFYVFEFPIITRANNHKKPALECNETKYMHGNGCKDWADCQTCPKSDCDWQAYPKYSRKVKANESE